MTDIETDLDVRSHVNVYVCAAQRNSPVIPIVLFELMRKWHRRIPRL